jgi:hypothetical protein
MAQIIQAQVSVLRGARGRGRDRGVVCLRVLFPSDLGFQAGSTRHRVGQMVLLDKDHSLRPPVHPPTTLNRGRLSTIQMLFPFTRAQPCQTSLLRLDAHSRR